MMRLFAPWELLIKDCIANSITVQAESTHVLEEPVTDDVTAYQTHASTACKT